jgi:SAM-dependent methyltransferase
MQSPQQWWQTFFSGLILDMWRAAMSPEQTRTEADFLQRVLAPPEKAKVFDVPCGTGRLALELARRGFRTTGVDIAEPYVRDADAQAKQENLKAEFYHRDMRELPWVGEFDAGFCMGNSFGYMDDDANAALLKTLARCLKPRARFVLNCGYVFECLGPNFQERRWYKVGDIYTMSQAKFDFVNSRLESEYTLIRDGKVEVKPATARMYSCRELLELLTQAGFTEIQVWGGMNGEAPKLGCPGLYFTAKKN